MKFLRALLPLALSVVLLFILNSKLGSAPPLGSFLCPFNGFWNNAEEEAPGSEELQLEGLEAEVRVLYDSSRVPHIFAGNDRDLYFAQGYVTARDRLWQMEFQTQAAAGRLSEIVGPVAVDFDRHQRRIGMVYGAQRSLELMMADPRTKSILEAYTDGINAYIRQLRPRDLPFEYKLLDYAPEAWDPLKCALLLKQMTKTLNGGSDDRAMSNVLQRYGEEVVAELFPDYPFIESPVIPAGTPWNFEPLPIPEKPPGAEALPPDPALAGREGALVAKKVPGTGSNNWAVSGSKTASGYPILANDPHLNLSLPSLWYQVQLSAPGLNVCGVSLPGAPGVIIGFNRDIAWGVTNVDPDVLDFYRIRFQDARKQAYWLDSAWAPVEERVESIQVRGAETVFDTVRYTRFGPVVYETDQKSFDQSVPLGYAARWIAHEGGNEVLSFYKLNRARTYEEYAEALRSYVAPAQNFVFASNSGDIALWVNGKFPLKWKGQGKFLLEGDRTVNDWQGWIPHAHNPHVKNPPRGFVSSANQFSAGPDYPYYLNWEYSQSDRAIRINELLEHMRQATADSIRLMQSDAHYKLAEWALPEMLAGLDTLRLQGPEKEAFRLLSSWDYQYSASSVAASIFDSWWTAFEEAIWKDQFDKEGAPPMRFPSRDRTVRLLREEKDAPWFDDIRTPEKEGFHTLVRDSFRRSLDSLSTKHGPPGKDWEWGRVKGTHVPHILGQKALGSELLYMGGAKGTINALDERNGPSWRMVVELGKPVRAWGVYPGGQSGNPGSPYYDNMIETWKQGKLNPLIFLEAPDERAEGIISSLVLK